MTGSFQYAQYTQRASRSCFHKFVQSRVCMLEVSIPASPIRTTRRASIQGAREIPNLHKYRAKSSGCWSAPTLSHWFVSFCGLGRSHPVGSVCKMRQASLQGAREIRNLLKHCAKSSGRWKARTLSEHFGKSDKVPEISLKKLREEQQSSSRAAAEQQ